MDTANLAREGYRSDAVAAHVRQQLERALGAPGPPQTTQQQKGADPTAAGQRQAAEQRLKEVPAAGPDHPMAKYMSSVRQQLAAQRLPVSAEGVPIYVNEPDGGSHAGEVVRAAAGANAPGRGAAVRLQLDEADEVVGASTELDPHTTMDQLATGRADAFVRAIKERTGAIHKTIADHKGSGDPRLAAFNMSWGRNVSTLAEGKVESMAEANPGSPLGKEINKILGHDVRSDRSDKEGRAEDLARLERTFADRIKAKLDTPEYQRQIAAEKATLSSAVAAANAANVLPISSAGNGMGFESTEKHPEYSTTSTAKVNGMLVVGASGIPRGTNPGDTEMYFASSVGADIVAPGEGIPVEKDEHNPKAPADIPGTSFSAPFVAGTVALMTKANPGLTATQAIDILRRTASPIPAASYTGAGAVNVVAAVAEARKLARGG